RHWPRASDQGVYELAFRNEDSGMTASPAREAKKLQRQAKISAIFCSAANRLPLRPCKLTVRHKRITD
ncbi:MAG TPA: hypothetical protein PLR25_25860, partial [Planctomycetaceae bacterium]|nr:hypothetical protein [Planctomycetaceae bacterium]